MTNKQSVGNLRRPRFAGRTRVVRRSILRSALAVTLAAAFLTLAPLGAGPTAGVDAWLGVDSARACPAEFQTCSDGGEGDGDGEADRYSGGGSPKQATGCYAMPAAVCVVCFDVDPACRIYNKCDSGDDGCTP